MLYRYKANGSGESAIAMRLIDWQILLPGRPGKDVAYFLFSSTKSRLRKDKGRWLIDNYVATLLSALKKLGAEESAFDHEQVVAGVKKQFLYGMFIGINVLPVILDGTMVSKMEEWGNQSLKNPPESLKILDNTQISLGNRQKILQKSFKNRQKSLVNR